MKRTPLYEHHKNLGAYFVEFAGWEMPLHYRTRILEEHATTRRYGGLFDVSHMGRFLISGKNALTFLQHLLTNNAAALEPGEAQYTLLPDEKGGAVDDTFLYRLEEDKYLLVVNAANTGKDWEWLNKHLSMFENVNLKNKTEEIVMIAFQGPRTRGVLKKIIDDSKLPEVGRNKLRKCVIDGIEVYVSRTGYTGEPIGFELFCSAEQATKLWDTVLGEGKKVGIIPVGLGARDSLRLEADLPLYGHELGVDEKGENIPIYALPQAKAAVSFSPLKGDFIGKEKLRKQLEDMKKLELYHKPPCVVKRRIYPVAIKERRIARPGQQVVVGNKVVGYVTSGTLVPYWEFEGKDVSAQITGEVKKRSICLAYLDYDLEYWQRVRIKGRDGFLEGKIVERHLGSGAPPYARPHIKKPEKTKKYRKLKRNLKEISTALTRKGTKNTVWRQRRCINLIPSENTPSSLVRLLSICDPGGRYAEHKTLKSLGKDEIYYYQGTGFIEEVEERLIAQLKEYFGCAQVEPRVISGQMANAVVFSALIEYLNKWNRKTIVRRRLRKVMTHHIGKGGHLSAQPLGPLRECIALDPRTDRSAVVNFEVREDNPYQIDVERTAELIEREKPELLVLGKSMVLHPEPVKELRKITDTLPTKPIIMYDMAHVLGLLGPHFQQPFEEGTDLVTGSTHKTFFGPQRGVIASDYEEDSEKYPLWECVLRRTFPGSVSNHHLGTLLGLLMATYEMNTFKHKYQQEVIRNAKAFAVALKDHGLKVEGDPSVNYTETHQVIIRVGYAKGPEVANKLEKNNIVVNYQAAPDDESFTCASCLRLGVGEMTRFGMHEDDFDVIAGFIADVILGAKNVGAQVARFRSEFTKMQYCLPREEGRPLITELCEKTIY